MAGTILEFERQPLLPLDKPINIYGPGIYCLMYNGDHPAYQEIARKDAPIYVGRATPKGARKGADGGLTDRALQRRIMQHKKSIDQAQDLDTKDFSYRYLAIKPAWIDLAERFALQQYKPVWNSGLDGFGIHTPGAGRKGSETSWWDTMHQGREFVKKLELKQTKTPEDACAKVKEFFDEETQDEEKEQTEENTTTQPPLLTPDE